MGRKPCCFLNELEDSTRKDRRGNATNGIRKTLDAKTEEINANNAKLDGKNGKNSKEKKRKYDGSRLWIEGKIDVLCLLR